MNSKFTSALLCLLVLAAFVQAGSRSVHWRPYDYEPKVIGLFHCDEAAGEGQTSVDDVLGDGPDGGLGGELGPGVGGETGKADDETLANANPVGKPARLVGSARPVPEGRFGGGIRLPSAESAVIYGESSAHGTTEFWFRTDDLPDEATTILQRGGKDDLRLLVHPDGTLELIIEEKIRGRTKEKLNANAWHHISVAASWEWKYEGRARITLDARVVLDKRPRWDYKVNNYIRGLTSLKIGGLPGTIDEIRLSKSIRSYYPSRLGWEDVAGKIGAPAGQPYFRDARDLLLRMGFNQSVQPDTDHRGVRVTEKSLRVKGLGESKESRGYDDGVHADALILGPEMARPTYAADDLLDTRAGTISFWMRPLNWDNFTRVDHRREKDRVRRLRLFRVFGKKPEQLRPYRPMRGGDPSLMSFMIDVTPKQSRPAPPKMHPGKWTHVTFTWKENRKKLYLDGDKVGYAGLAAQTHAWYRKGGEQHRTENILLGSKPKRLQIEGRSGDRRTLLDDFRVYRRPLTDSEIRNLVALYDPRRKLDGLPPMEIAFSYNGVEGWVSASATPLMRDYQDVHSVALRLSESAAGQSIGETTVSCDPLGRTDIRLSTRSFGFGKYELRIAARDDAGQTLAAIDRSFERNKPPWWENELGVSREVMPGWTPVEADSNTVSVTRRTVEFDHSGLPRRVVSEGENVLADAPALMATVSGQTQHWEPAVEAPEIATAGEVRATARGRSHAENLTLEGETSLEFDGMMWIRLTVSPRGDSAELDEMALELPYSSENAEIIHWWSGAREFRNPRTVHIGAVRESEGTIFRSNDRKRVNHPKQLAGNFIPYVMLTGDRRGMAWFAENDRGWTRTKKTPAVEVVRGGGEVVLQLNIVSRPLTLHGPRTVEFGLHPIPIKPRLPYWRQTDGWGVIPDTFADSNLKGDKGSTAFYLYPNISWDEVMERYEGSIMEGRYQGDLKTFRAHHDRPPRPLEIRVPGLYQDLHWIGGFPEHSREWSGRWTANYSVHTPEFIDFCAWAWHKWIVHTDRTVRGIYLDDCWGAPKSKPISPASYELPDGRTQVGYEWRGYRERLKRIRQVAHDLGVTPQICAHSTHTFFAPYHAFFDIVLDGEDHYQEPPNQKDFIDYWSLPRMRFMNSAKWGIITSWLGWHGNSSDADKYPAYQWRHQRAYAGMLALHDIAWPFASSLRGKFRLRDEMTQFAGYWDDENVGSAEDPNVQVSAWRRKGKCLVLAVNTGDERAEARIQLRVQNMGLAGTPPGQLTVEDIDATLLRYFDEDITRMEKPDAGTIAEEQQNAVPDLGLEERPEDIPVEERRAKDPDGAYEWKNGVLRCPIRRHDYRLFLFSARDGGQ